MQNLYWIKASKSGNILPKPFDSEMKFEEYVYKNQDLLGDIVILHRQIMTGAKQGIPDMLGIDQDGRICILEMKNVTVDESILPQVLGYAMWAETNPDSIKAIWLESKNRPDDIEIDWDSLEIRIVVIAPDYRGSVQRMAGKINYPLELVKIQRFALDQDEFLLVETLEEEASKKPTITKVMGDWTWEYYESIHGKQTTSEFRKAVDELSTFTQKHNLALSYNLNKYYTGFKLGNKVVFSVHWASTFTWELSLKIPLDLASGFAGKTWKFNKYSHHFKESTFRLIEGARIDISELTDLLLAAYHNVLG
jgi:hypothetical protein